MDPESITVLDPACGSGHILVEAYALLKGIYLERGYRLRDIPRLILEKNLYGLDIDDRAAQLAGFALLMKARADDRRLLDKPPRLNVLVLRESKAVASGQWSVVSDDATLATAHSQLITVFEHAKTFGSLIQIPDALNAQLPSLAEALGKANETGDLYAQAAAQDLLQLVEQAKVLGRKFDAVVANPPYMGSKGMNSALKEFAKATFPDSKSDLFAMFIERGFGWCKASGFNSMVTMQSWMFLSSYEAMREKLLKTRTLSCMVHMGNGVMGIAFGTAATVMLREHVTDHAAKFSYCENDDIEENEKPNQFPVQNERLKTAKPDDFKRIPGSPIAYWVSESVRSAFSDHLSISRIADTRKGMATGDNARFVRQWSEVAFDSIGIGFDREEARCSSSRWFPYANGGEYRKWFGNLEDVVFWESDGAVLQTELHESGRVRAVNINLDYIFREGVTWTSIGSGDFSCRLLPKGSLFSSAANSLFCERPRLIEIMAVLNSVVFRYLSKSINPTVNTNPGDAGKIPFPELADCAQELITNTLELIELSKQDWDDAEISWDFQSLRLVRMTSNGGSLAGAWELVASFAQRGVERVAELEERNNRILINALGLQSELVSEVPADQIALTTADREKDSQRLISYVIGCMMGRYSLDEPGLIYAHAGNIGFDATRYKTFPADADGIVPITDEFWFEDDAANRVREFLRAVWGDGAVVSDQQSVDSKKLTTDHSPLSTNMQWLADSLNPKPNETPDETIRRYLADKFFKDHLQTYKKRPIYWLFSSGKQGAFQALVYLHRYHEGTLARLRAEYVVPLTGKMQARIEMLEKDATAAPSTAARNKLNKQIEKLRKKHVELLAYDEKLRHYADMRISLDLDDGVKVNYSKFGDLLAEVKAVTGGAED